MYCGEIERLLISLAWKLGLHPSTLAHLSNITISLPKWVPMTNVRPQGHLFAVDYYHMLSICF
jgi:hypothetical protein